jgi:hypothetical protein
MEEKKPEESASTRHVSKASAPIEPLTGYSWTPPEKIAVPELPLSYPDELSLQTNTILAKAAPLYTRAQILQYCQRVFSELTPLIGRRTLKDDRIDQTMRRLVDCIFVFNRCSDSERDRVSRELWQSSEWVKLCEALGQGLVKVFDEHLYELKMRGPRRGIQGRLVDSGYLLSAIAWEDDYEFSKDLCEFLDEADKMCRETWESARNTINEKFIQGVMLPHVMTALSECETSIRSSLSDSTIFSVSPRPVSPVALECFERKIVAIKNAISERYEIEQCELAKQESLSVPGLADLLEMSKTAPILRAKKTTVGSQWFESNPDTVRRRQIVLKNPRMPSKSLCKVFDRATPPIPLLRDWQAELAVDTWSEAYENRVGRKRVQKIICTDRRAGKI